MLQVFFVRDAGSRDSGGSSSFTKASARAQPVCYAAGRDEVGERCSRRAVQEGGTWEVHCVQRRLH